MIGAYYSFAKPYNYIRTTIKQIIKQIKYTFSSYKNFYETIINFIKKSSYAKEISIYFDQLKDSYKYASGAIIIIIIVFIILNMFTNVNKKFLIFIKNIIRDEFSSKFSGIIKKYKKFKKRQLEEEAKKEKEIEKNEESSNKINNMKNLTINQIKNFFN